MSTSTQDPAILGWETLNEGIYKMEETDPDDDVETGSETDGSTKPTAAEMDGWTSDIASYIKDIDPNHLIIDGR